MTERTRAKPAPGNSGVPDGRPCLLVVDDQPSNIHILAEALREHYELLVATSGQRALALVDEHAVDLVLLDVVMPGMDGYEVCLQLKQRPESRDIPVIFVTALNEVHDEERGFEVGGMDYITKPISPPIVRARVRTHLQLKQQLRVAMELEESRRSHLEELSLAAAGLAHETKNPLGLIRGLAQHLAQEPDLPEPLRVRAEQILDAADHAAVRLGEFIAYARLRAPRVEPLDARAVVRRALDVLAADAEAHGVALHSQVELDALEADEEMLLQVLLNLLLNSLQASAPGSSVRVHVHRDGAGGVLLVEDEGHGIEPDLLPDVFKPYVSGRPGGHGLGLSIVRRLAQQHGWSVELDSAPGDGTRIRVAGLKV